MKTDNLNASIARRCISTILATVTAALLFSGCFQNNSSSPEKQVKTTKSVPIVDDGPVPLNKVRRSLKDPIISISFSADGKQMLTGSANGLVKVWDRETRRVIRTFRIGQGGTYFSKPVAFSRDGTLAIAVRGDKEDDDLPAVWNVAKGKKLVVLERGHSGQCLSNLEFSPSGEYVAGCGLDCVPIPGTETDDQPFPLYKKTGMLRVWDTSSGKLVKTLAEHEAGGAVRTAIFSTDGATLMATGEAIGGFRVWDWPDGNEICSVPVASGNSRAAYYLPMTGTVIVLPGPPAHNPNATPPKAYVYNLKTKGIERDWTERDPRVNSVIVAPKGDRVLILKKLEENGLRTYQIVVRNAATAQDIFDFDPLPQQQQQQLERPVVYTAAFSPDGRQVILALDADEENVCLKAWDIDSRKEIATFQDK